MSVPPEVMKMMMAQGGQGQGTQKPPPSGPTAAPISTQQSPDGEMMSASLNVALALDLLERALPTFGSETEQGRALMQALNSLGRQFGNQRRKTDDLVPAELMQLMQQMPKGAMGAPPGAGAPPGMPPGGMPPGMPPGMPH